MHQHTRRVGDFLLSPVFLISVAVLLLNDFVLKRVAPGVVSGKLSDVTGPIVASLIFVAVGEMLARRLKGTSWAKPWWFAGMSCLVVAVFAVVKVNATASALYVRANQSVLNVVSYLLDAVALPSPRADVDMVLDLTDVAVALLAIPAVIWVGVRWRRTQAEPERLGDSNRDPTAEE